MNQNSCTQFYGYAANFMHEVTGYMHQVFKCKNKNSHCENNFSCKEALTFMLRNL
jgi:hypothetical protein